MNFLSKIKNLLTEDKEIKKEETKENKNFTVIEEEVEEDILESEELEEDEIIQVEKEYTVPHVDILKDNKLFTEAMTEIRNNYNNTITLPIGIEKDENIIYKNIGELDDILIGGSFSTYSTSLINSMLASILVQYKPDEFKLVLIDYSQIEFLKYSEIPHLLYPIITFGDEITFLISKLCVEMEDRYRKLAEMGFKKIEDYNKNNEFDKMPYILIIINDIYMPMDKYLKDYLMYLTQKGNVVGIHLIFSTSRLTKSVIPDEIKMCMNTRISFLVSESKYSKFIISESGAEKLSNNGNFYLKSIGEAKKELSILQVTDDELNKIIDYVTNGRDLIYNERFESYEIENKIRAREDDDPLYNEIVNFAIEVGKISASLIQRRFGLRYNRAARIIDTMEERGILGPQNGSKPREVLIKKDY